MRKIKLIYNSGAGQSKFKYFLDTILEKFMQNGFEVSMFRASKKTNLYEFLKDVDKEKYYAIVVAGGDGTINRVVNVIMQNNIKTPLGIIPAGTSNDFARHIKMPSNFSECIDRILAGNIQKVDVGLVNNKYFINVCAAGLFANASQKANKNLKNSLGKLSYFITAAEQLIRFRPFTVKIETEKDIIIEKINVFMVFNGSSVGGIDKFTTDPSVQDGLLDVVILKNFKFYQVPSIVFNVLRGNHYEDDNIIYLREKWININKIKGKCDGIDVDGEEGPAFPLKIKCIEKGINMLL